MTSDGDLDDDGIPDSEDFDVDGDGIPNPIDKDFDGDGVLDHVDSGIFLVPFIKVDLIAFYGLVN